jgi:hypothetical protein
MLPVDVEKGREFVTDLEPPPPPAPPAAPGPEGAAGAASGTAGGQGGSSAPGDDQSTSD